MLHSHAWPDRWPLRIAVIILCVSAIAAVAWGQLRGGAAGGDKAVVQAQGEILPPEAGKPAQLRITAKINRGWHIYSLTQNGGPIATKIKLPDSPDYRLAGEFRALTAPASHVEPLFDNATVEEHAGEAVWQAPLEVAPGVDPKTLKISGAVFAQACAQSCLRPQDYPFVATLAAGGASAPPPATTPAAVGSAPRLRSAPLLSPSQAKRGRASRLYQHPSIHAKLSGALSPGSIAPGSEGEITVQAEVSSHYHIYALAATDENVEGYKPTLIRIAPSPGLKFSAAAPVEGAKSKTPPTGRSSTKNTSPGGSRCRWRPTPRRASA